MIKKPFTPENCPIQIGQFIWNPSTNSDLIVLERFYKGTSPSDPIIRTCLGTFSGNELMDNNIEYYIGDISLKQKEGSFYEEEEEEEYSYRKIRECLYKIDSTLELCAEVYENTVTGEKELTVINKLDNTRCYVAVLQSPGSRQHNYGSVVLVNESNKNILCKINNTKWVHYMLGDCGYDTVDDSVEAVEYVQYILSDIAQYWR